MSAADAWDLAGLAAEIYARSLPEDPDGGKEQAFEDRSVKLETTFEGAGVLSGTYPGCATVVQAVLDALSAPAGAEDTRSYAQRYHDGLQEAMRRLVTAGLLPERAGQPVEGGGARLAGGPDAAGRQLGATGEVDRAGPRGLGCVPGRRLGERQRRRRVAGRRRRPRDRV